jgi:histidinol-phosphatase (PHP family)
MTQQSNFQKPGDYHIHTSLCHHASGDMEAYVQSAINKGIPEIGFADHAPAKPGFDPIHRMNLEEVPVYMEKVLQLRNRFPQIRILLGIEADIYPGFEPYLEDLLKRFSFDYVIGSVHYIQNLPTFLVEPVSFSQQERQVMIRQYFELLASGFHSGLLHVVGHLDVLKWILPEDKDLIHIYASEFLNLFNSQNIIMEVNTSGLRKPPKEIYPDSYLIEKAGLAGIPVCLGSDAHRPKEIAADFDSALRLLKDAGYTHQSKIGSGLMGYLPGNI